MIENWINQHPWMTFVLGVMSLLTLNTFFVSIGGGYKRHPLQQKEESKHNKVMSD
jgi:hypothetical protein